MRCEWLTGSGSTYETDCGRELLLPYTGAKFCPSCGGEIFITDGTEDRAIIQQKVRPDKSGKCAYPKAFIVCSWFDAGLCKSPDGICRST